MIHYTEEGKGFPIVLIHGFCETHEVWLKVAQLWPMLSHGKHNIPAQAMTERNTGGEL